MPNNPNRLSQFWQELKRRNVVRVITVYAGAAFVILELVDIIAEPMKLPSWLLPVVIILFSIGFIIAAILSWIYDIHPGGILVKTVIAPKVKAEDVTKASNRWKIASYISFVVIIGLIVLNVIPRKYASQTRAEYEKSIAVLPFQNLSEEEGNEHFVDGLVEDLLNKLCVIERLKVTSRTSSDLFRERGVKSVPEIARELNVSYIVEGSVQRYGEKARITVQLIDAIRDDHLWSENYDRDLRDIFKTQSEIALRIASELEAILTNTEKAIIEEEKTKNIKAFELYQLGRYHWNKRTKEGFDKSLEYYNQAVDLDPGYGLAWAGLADTYYIMAFYGWIDRQVGIDKAVELAHKALELDESLAEAYTVLGSIYNTEHWDWEKAETSFKRALTLNPSFSTTHQYYGEHLAILGKFEEARIHLNKAVELNPFSFIIRNMNARIYYHQGLFEEALHELSICDKIQEAHRRIPEYRFLSYWQLGEEDRAFESLLLVLSYNPMYELETAKRIFRESGLKEVYQWKIQIDIAEAEGKIGAYRISRDLAMMGKYEEALDWLEIAFQSGQTRTIKREYAFRPLHDHPRFQAILQKMDLEE